MKIFAIFGLAVVKLNFQKKLSFLLFNLKNMFGLLLFYASVTVLQSTGLKQDLFFLFSSENFDSLILF